MDRSFIGTCVYGKSESGQKWLKALGSLQCPYCPWKICICKHKSALKIRQQKHHWHMLQAVVLTRLSEMAVTPPQAMWCQCVAAAVDFKCKTDVWTKNRICTSVATLLQVKILLIITFTAVSWLFISWSFPNWHVLKKFHPLAKNAEFYLWIWSAGTFWRQNWNCNFFVKCKYEQRTWL